jgi:hypothetical protein
MDALTQTLTQKTTTTQTEAGTDTGHTGHTNPHTHLQVNSVVCHLLVSRRLFSRTDSSVRIRSGIGSHFGVCF